MLQKSFSNSNLSCYHDRCWATSLSMSSWAAGRPFFVSFFFWGGIRNKTTTLRTTRPVGHFLWIIIRFWVSDVKMVWHKVGKVVLKHQFSGAMRLVFRECIPTKEPQIFSGDPSVRLTELSRSKVVVLEPDEANLIWNFNLHWCLQWHHL